jgi:hypothetical protein
MRYQPQQSWVGQDLEERVEAARSRIAAQCGEVVWLEGLRLPRSVLPRSERASHVRSRDWSEGESRVRSFFFFITLDPWSSSL